MTEAGREVGLFLPRVDIAWKYVLQGFVSNISCRSLSEFLIAGEAKTEFDQSTVEVWISWFNLELGRCAISHLEGKGNEGAGNVLVVSSSLGGRGDDGLRLKLFDPVREVYCGGEVVIDHGHSFILVWIPHA